MAEAPPSLPGVVSGITQQNFDALNRRLSGAEKELEGGSEVFLKLGVGGSHKIAFGNTTVKFPGASNASNTKTIVHGLGLSPSAVDLTCVGTAGGVGGNFAELTGGATSTEFTLRALNPFVQPAANAELVVTWIAIG